MPIFTGVIRELLSLSYQIHFARHSIYIVELPDGSTANLFEFQICKAAA